MFRLCLRRIVAAVGLGRLQRRKKVQNTSAKLTSYSLEKDLRMDGEELRASHCGGLSRIPEIVVVPPTPKRQPRSRDLSLPPHPNNMSFAQRMGQAGPERPKSTLSSIPLQSSRNGFILADGFLAEEERRKFDGFFESAPEFRGLKPRPSPKVPDEPLEMSSDLPTDWYLDVPFGAPFTGKPSPSESKHGHKLCQVVTETNASNQSPPSLTTTLATETTSTFIGTPESQSELKSENDGTRRNLADVENQMMRITQLAEDFSRNPVVWRGMNQVDGNLPVEDPIAMIRASMLAMLCRIEMSEGKRPWRRRLSVDPYVEEWREEARQHGYGKLRVVN